MNNAYLHATPAPLLSVSEMIRLAVVKLEGEVTEMTHRQRGLPGPD